jgi:hypothetical protein
MAVFFVLLLVPMVIQHIAVRGVDNQKKNKVALALFFSLLTILVMLRHESIGNDTRNYREFFRIYADLPWSVLTGNLFRIRESLFPLFNKIISLFSKQPQFYLAVTAVIITVLIYPTYKRLCIDSSLTIVLYCILSTFVMMFSGIRQMIAIAIGFWAYEFARQKKLLPFILSVAAAMLFHTSAFMLAFMYPLYHARITKKWLYVVVPVLVTVFQFNERIFTMLGLLLERYTEFAGTIEETGAYTMIILFSLFVMFSYVIPDERRLDDETIGLRNFLLLSLVVQLFAPLNSLAMRMGYYYTIFIPLLLPKIIACRSRRWDQVAVFARHAMVVVFLIYFFVIKVNNEGNLNVFPYHFFWENIG